MTVNELSVPEVKVIIPDVFGDNRGYLTVPFSQRDYEKLGIYFQLRQINQGFSNKIHTIRGLHYQQGEFAQAKLVSACNGAILSVAVDIRRNSPYFGKWCGEILSADNRKIMYIPRGFAHGYLTLDENVLMQYCVDNDFCADATRSVRFDDSDIGVKWIFEPDISTLSAKDAGAARLEDVYE